MTWMNVGGKIVVTPDELLTPYDRKSGERFLTYLPDGGGPVYFSSYGKNGADRARHLPERPAAQQQVQRAGAAGRLREHGRRTRTSL
jgi:hypothetical protein